MGTVFLNEYHMLWYFSGYLGYLVLAHYIRVHLTWGAPCVCGSVSCLCWSARRLPYGRSMSRLFREWFILRRSLRWDGLSALNCVALTAGTFLLFGCISIPQPPRIIAEMSKLSYGMFLMHIFWLGLWVLVFKSTLGLPTVAAIPVIAVCTFISCFVVTKLISLIPGSKGLSGSSLRSLSR